MFDMALYNSFVVWKILTGKRESFTEFWLNFVEQILEHVTLPLYPSRGRLSLGPSPLRLQTKNWAHFVMKIPPTATKANPTKRCFVCAQKKLGGSVTITCAKTGYNAKVEFLTKPFYGGRANRIKAEVFSPNERKPFLTVEGFWNGAMEAKWADGKTEPFVDVNKLSVTKKIVRPIKEQIENESRRVWKEVTAGLRSLKPIPGFPEARTWSLQDCPENL
uniref:Uncharacterized protein n=1 Tax=Timema monikensis TaxID=170555 RepID=A0A7R9DXR5_9NEOP|nr:unnamed protein product [Timema monikensis]